MTTLNLLSKVKIVNESNETKEIPVSEVKVGDRLLCWGNASKPVTTAGVEHKASMHKVAVEGAEVPSGEQIDLEAHTVPELRDIAEKLEIEGASSMLKAELIAAIEERSPQVMEAPFYWANFNSLITTDGGLRKVRQLKPSDRLVTHEQGTLEFLKISGWASVDCRDISTGFPILVDGIYLQ